MLRETVDAHVFAVNTVVNADAGMAAGENICLVASAHYVVQENRQRAWPVEGRLADRRSISISKTENHK